ncbi:MAG: hypothetical protein ACLR6L_11895, partial [Agathobaculum sp.]
ERHLAKVEVASSSLVSRSKSKDTDVIRCFSFIRSTLASSTFIKSEVGVWMRVRASSAASNQKAPMYSVLFVLPKPPAAVNSLPVYRFTMIVQ